MSLDDLVGLLARVPAFAGMGRGLLVYIAQYAMPRYFEPGDVLYCEGEGGDAAYLLVYGDAVAVSEFGFSAEFTQGALLGEMAMLTDVACTTTCVAKSRLTTLEITRPLMHDLLQRDAAALHFTRSRLSRRIEDIRANLELVQQTLEPFAVPGEARIDAAPHGSFAGGLEHYLQRHDAIPGGEEAEFPGESPVFDDGEPPVFDDGELPMPPEFAQVLSVLESPDFGEDRNVPLPEYDLMELPSLWPRAPVAA